TGKGTTVTSVVRQLGVPWDGAIILRVGQAESIANSERLTRCHDKGLKSMEKKLDAIALKLQENELELELAKERRNLFGCVDLAGRNTHDAQVERYCCREMPLTVENLSKDVIDSRGRAYLWMVVT
ncbi:hypothetical protein FOZ62_017175, partial [Perkinsus olseni]